MTDIAEVNIACFNLLWFVLKLSVQKQEVQFYVMEIQHRFVFKHKKKVQKRKLQFFVSPCKVLFYLVLL